MFRSKFSHYEADDEDAFAYLSPKTDFNPLSAKPQNWIESEMRNLIGLLEFIFHKTSIYTAENNYFGLGEIPFIQAGNIPFTVSASIIIKQRSGLESGSGNPGGPKTILLSFIGL